MNITEIPFDAEQIREPNIIRAIVETARGEKPGPFSGPHAGSYGAVICGRGELLKIWGAGYSPSEDILRACAVRRILEAHRGDAELVVYSKGLEDQLGHVSRSWGYKADRKTPFAGFDDLKPIQAARDRGEWKLVQFKARREPDGFNIAQGLAEFALKTANVLRPLFSQLAADSQDYRIIATDQDPDPDGIVSRLKGAA